MREIVIQVNGKSRDRMTVEDGVDGAEIERPGPDRRSFGPKRLVGIHEDATAER